MLWIAARVVGAARAANAANADVGLAIMTPSAISRLNAMYRGKRGPTDILSFSGADDDLMEEDATNLGDMYVCLDEVAEQGGRQRQAGEPPSTEALTEVLVHGVLHLCGHDHETPEDAARMEAAREAVMERLEASTPAVSLLAAAAVLTPDGAEGDSVKNVHVEWDEIAQTRA